MCIPKRANSILVLTANIANSIQTQIFMFQTTIESLSKVLTNRVNTLLFHSV
jgi:hypothetical protein